MKIKILHNNGEIFKAVSEADYARRTYKTKLPLSVFMIDDELENEDVIKDLYEKRWERQEAGNEPVYSISGNQLLKDGEPVDLAVNTAKESVRQAYDDIVSSLETLASANLDTVAKRVTAIKGLGENQLKLVKFIYNNLV